MNRAEVVRDIESAFGSVVLEDGIGVFEAIALHGHVSDQDREQIRNTDFREKWQDIPDDIIANNGFALYFMDPKGLRFNLPAYMRFALLHYDEFDSDSFDSVIYAVSKEQHDIDHEWAIFSEAQKAAIAKFLRYMVVEAGDRVDSQQAAYTYGRLWKQYDKLET
jgi:Family of unknown function (DUF6714)